MIYLTLPPPSPPEKLVVLADPRCSIPWLFFGKHPFLPPTHWMKESQTGLISNGCLQTQLHGLWKITWKTQALINIRVILKRGGVTRALLIDSSLYTLTV